MRLTRRRFLVGAGLGLLRPPSLRAQPALAREHQPKLDLPILAEDATAVPIQAWVDHPMEPDHYIKSIELTVEQDPVPDKGKFFFTPGNGRAWIAFPMRSGTGGLARAVAECSKHGRFVGTREYRVADGGCSTGPDPASRERLGNPQLRLPRALRSGETVEVKVKVDHGSYTGLALRNGKFVREAPEFYVKEMLVFLDDEKLSEFRMTSAVSANPQVRFPFRASRSGTLRVIFVNSEGHRWEASHGVRL
ncbi:MAG TPA: thiosulfate oxidation carrier protein SoxY [Methylomirabilota bacterium]|jgi:predicted secreted protein|nr:thiosulfate oxidation carrier protein SoxY [Methylomirabilota bacterium]